jgi:hypothetical protein
MSKGLGARLFIEPWSILRYSAPHGRACSHGIIVAMKIRGMLGIQRPTLLRNPVTSIGRKMQDFSSVRMRNIWWVHECDLFQIKMQKEDPYICMTSKNRRVGIVVGEAAARFSDLRLEMYPASLKHGPLPDIHLPPILYATRIPPKLVNNMGPPLHSLTCRWPRSKCSLPNFHFTIRKSKAGFSNFVFPLCPEIINTPLHCYPADGGR